MPSTQRPEECQSLGCEASEKVCTDIGRAPFPRVRGSEGSFVSVQVPTSGLQSGTVTARIGLEMLTRGASIL